MPDEGPHPAKAPTAEHAKNAEHYYYKKEGFLCELGGLRGEPKRNLGGAVSSKPATTPPEGKPISLAGLDEAGRGALAGPVVVGCVRFDLEKSILHRLIGLNDSKRLSPIKRERLFTQITKIARYGVGRATPREIDRYGIVPAVCLASRRAYHKLGAPVDLLLLDRGISLVGFTAEDAKAAENRCKKEKFLCDLSVLCGKYPPELSFTRGDTLSMHIAAASIIAKVVRDRYMIERGRDFPEYGFERHKGYGTRAHLATLERHGPSPIHRTSFRLTGTNRC